MALAERNLAARFGEHLVDHNTYVIASDGDLMEGISHEAGSFAGHLGLSRLIVFFLMITAFQLTVVLHFPVQMTFPNDLIPTGGTPLLLTDITLRRLQVLLKLPRPKINQR